MERREALSLSSLAAVATALAPLARIETTWAQETVEAEGQTRVVRIYSDEQELVVATTVNGQPRQPPWCR